MEDPRSALGATLRGDGTIGASFAGVTSAIASESAAAIASIELLDLDETGSGLAAPVDGPRTQAPSQTNPARTTVLPRRRPTVDPLVEQRARFDRVRVLGHGGMGEVELVRDNDIRRTVALKRLHGHAQSAEALLRFADEVRIVGQLEHPSIVPIYDVGRDESGQVYLVMKHLNGETMERVIEKLRAKDAASLELYTIEYRIHLFLAVLDALRYAHARGIIHRDLKPANIMIGHYGEVTVLDWGIAKPIRQDASAPPAEGAGHTSVGTHDSRLQETQLGSLAGTPLYMSPEQAAGRNDDLDERTDVYSLCVVLYEWLALSHPLQGGKTVTEVLSATIHGLDLKKVAERAVMSGVPAEWAQLTMKGLVKDRESRIPSVVELDKRIRSVLDGHLRVECHVTLTKRAAYGLLGWIDRHPILYSVFFYLVVLTLVGVVAYGGYGLVRRVV